MRTLRYGLVLVAFVNLFGCSKANDNSSFLDASGKHPANWIVNHRESFRTLAGAIDDPGVAAKSKCAECHGSDLKGGITKVSCFSQSLNAMTCHFHPAGFRNADNHGADAKAFGVSLGMRTCQGCHGSQYVGGLFSRVSCSSTVSLTDPSFACHGIGAPHAGNWATSTTRQHSSSDPNNAEACAQCHSGGRFLTHLPAPPPQPSGTTPSCFNNTLCHAGLHPTGWIDPAQHGVTAKSQPGSDKGFTSCQVCHGADFTGGASKASCFSVSSPNGSCHVRNGASVNAPHPPVPWRAASPSPTHTSTVDDAEGLNVKICAQCHLRGANLRTPILTSYASGAPGCFNSTLCHGALGHPVGWADPSQHGATAKANITFCQTCHSNNPNGGPGSNPRFNVVLGRLTAGCETCHIANAAHPPVLQIPAAFGITSPDPIGTPWFRHRTSTNFDACNRCHGANLDGGVGPRCQKCHVAALPTSTRNSPDPCSSCHSQPPSGTTYPNINRVHGSHATLNVPTGGLCVECHSGLGSGTLDHFLRAKNISLVGASSTQPNAVVFGGVLSKANGAAPVFTLGTLRCDNTYCHGTTLASNSPAPAGVILSPTWNTPFPAGSHCGRCHGFPPANAAHNGLTSSAVCRGCHPHVNTTSDGFTDPSKHVNGVIDVTAGSAHGFPNPGSAHKGSSTGCLACHSLSAGTNPYPVAAGTPPNCRACHLNANPGTDPQCSDCHGAAANDKSGALSAGRPIGAFVLAAPATNFPNRQGQHFNPNHVGRACTVCHPFTTGDARHGWSNRQPKSTAAQVNASVGWNPAGNLGRGTCSNGCHGIETWY